VADEVYPSTTIIAQDWLCPEYDVRSTFCGWEGKRSLLSSGGWKVGDAVYHDPDRPMIDTCPKCGRQDLVITSTPPPLPLPEPEGFWKIPEK
jgi:hypothetical protein